MAPDPASLTAVVEDADIVSFRRNGFLGISDFADADEIARLHGVVRSLFERGAGRLYGDQFDMAGPDTHGNGVNIAQVLHAARYAPELFTSPIRAKAFAIARRILGPEAELDFDHAIYKRPGNGVPTAWHQDEAYYDGRYDHDVMTFWIPLQDVTAEGGCLEFIPGSHLGHVRAHRRFEGDPRMHALECTEVDDRFRVVFPIPAGAATVHHCRVVHYSGPNASETPRYVYAMCFKAPRVERGGDDFGWAGTAKTAARDRFLASRAGRGGLINRVLRRASLLLQRANEWNERRTIDRAP